jgi:hypothetical protein
MVKSFAWTSANNLFFRRMASSHTIPVALLLSFGMAVAEPTTKESAQSKAMDTHTQIRDIPEAFQKAITNGSLSKEYELAFHLNPFYLRGDFNGDGKTDVAVLVKQRPAGKVGIAVIDGVNNKVQIIGAGTPIGNGGDDFEWMDTWQVYSKTRAAHATDETGVPHLRGDALLVEKSEAASALIYWNGKRYVWSQRGD